MWNSHLVIVAVPLSLVSGGVERIVEDVIVTSMRWIVRRDDGVRNMGDLAPRVSRLPPLPAIVEDLEILAPHDSEFLVVVRRSGISDLHDLHVTSEKVVQPSLLGPLVTRHTPRAPLDRIYGYVAVSPGLIDSLPFLPSIQFRGWSVIPVEVFHIATFFPALVVEVVTAVVRLINIPEKKVSLISV